MLIEFQLPSGAGGMAAAHALGIIKQELRAWSKKYNISYTEKTVKYTHRVCFDNDAVYSFFAVTWQPKGQKASWFQFKLIPDRNNRQ